MVLHPKKSSLQNRRIFLRFLGERSQKRGERAGRAKIERRALSRFSFAFDEKSGELPASRATRGLRFPRFRLLSPKIRKKLRLFCRLKKSEAMLISRQKFVFCLQAVTINGTSIDLLSSTRCLGVVLDSQISWTPHPKATIKLFARKLNLLR